MNIYADKKDDDMSKWSQDELEQSIAKRFGVAKVRACMPGVFVYSLWIHAWMDGWMMYWREREAEWTMKVRCNECSECTWVCSWIPMRHVHVHTLTPHSYHSPRTHRSRRVSWCASTSSRPLRRRSMDGSGSALTESHGTCRSGIPAFIYLPRPRTPQLQHTRDSGVQSVYGRLCVMACVRAEAYTAVCLFVLMRVCSCLFVFVCVRVCLFVLMRVCSCLSVFVRACSCSCMHANSRRAEALEQAIKRYTRASVHERVYVRNALYMSKMRSLFLRWNDSRHAIHYPPHSMLLLS